MTTTKKPQTEREADEPFHFHICNFSDARDYVLDAGGKRWRFEWSDMFGPLVIGKNLKPLVNQPTRDHHPFLMAVSYWFRQGKRVSADGVCIWEKPPPLVMQHIGGRHYMHVSGEHDDIDPSNVIKLPRPKKEEKR